MQAACGRIGFQYIFPFSRSADTESQLMLTLGLTWSLRQRRSDWHLMASHHWQSSEDCPYFMLLFHTISQMAPPFPLFQGPYQWLLKTVQLKSYKPNGLLHEFVAFDHRDTIVYVHTKPMTFLSPSPPATSSQLVLLCSAEQAECSAIVPHISPTSVSISSPLSNIWIFFLKSLRIILLFFIFLKHPHPSQNYYLSWIMIELLNLFVERHVCPVSNILVILTLPHPCPLVQEKT